VTMNLTQLTQEGPDPNATDAAAAAAAARNTTRQARDRTADGRGADASERREEASQTADQSQTREGPDPHARDHPRPTDPPRQQGSEPRHPRDSHSRVGGGLRSAASRQSDAPGDNHRPRHPEGPNLTSPTGAGVAAIDGLDIFTPLTNGFRHRRAVPNPVGPRWLQAVERVMGWINDAATAQDRDRALKWWWFLPDILWRTDRGGKRGYQQFLQRVDRFVSGDYDRLVEDYTRACCRAGERQARRSKDATLQKVNYGSHPSWRNRGSPAAHRQLRRRQRLGARSARCNSGPDWQTIHRGSAHIGGVAPIVYVPP